MNCFWWCRDSRRPPAGIRLDAPEVRSQCVGARAYAAPVLNTHPSESIEEIERRAISWVEGLDKTEKTGSRHHTVPRFYLDRFADNGRLWVRDRAADLAPGTGSARHVRDMGVKDFYTSLTVDEVLDSRLEQVLSLVEAQGAAVLARLLNPFRLPGPLTADEEVHLSQFLSFQVVRGQRWRREIELMGDWYAKTLASSHHSQADLKQVRFVPHPNNHLRMLGQAAQELQPWLLGRPCVVVILDRPLMLTCDEPVIFRCDNPVEHLPDCGMSEEEFRRRRKKTGRKGTDRRTVHMYPARPRGAAFAYEIILPLAPSKLLVLGPQGSRSQPVRCLTGREAEGFAAEMNSEIIANAYGWIAGHPDNQEFRAREFDPPGALLNVCDGGSFMSEAMQEAPAPRSVARLRADCL